MERQGLGTTVPACKTHLTLNPSLSCSITRKTLRYCASQANKSLFFRPKIKRLEIRYDQIDTSMILYSAAVTFSALNVEQKIP
jgi:hypothetical protein